MTRIDPRRGDAARPRRPKRPAGERVRGDRARVERARGAATRRAEPASSGDPEPVRGRSSTGWSSRARTYRRRRLAAAALAGLVLLVGLGLTGRLLLYDAGLADVEDVRVTGALVVPVPDVLAAAAVVPGVPLASVDTDAVAARVEELRGVGRAEVTRDWPHAVVVEVFERTPVAVAAAPGGAPVLVDAGGVGYAPATASAGLPVLTFGPVGPDDPATRAALAVLAALPEPLRADVREVDVGAAGNITLRLAGDREVRWGGADATAEKAAVLAALLTRPGRVYDVSSPALPTIRR